MFPCLWVVYVVLVAVGFLLETHTVVWLVVRVAWLLLEAPAEKALPRTKRTPNRLIALKPLTGIKLFLMIFILFCF